MRPDETRQLVYQQTCLKDVRNWMSHNFLMLNSTAVLGPKHIWDSLSTNIVHLNSIALATSTTVRNLDVIFDQELSFNSHVKQISRTASMIHWPLFYLFLWLRLLLCSSKFPYFYTNFTSPELCFDPVGLPRSHGNSCCGLSWCLLTTLEKEILWLGSEAGF